MAFGRRSSRLVIESCTLCDSRLWLGRRGRLCVSYTPVWLGRRSMSCPSRRMSMMSMLIVVLCAVAMRTRSPRPCATPLFECLLLPHGRHWCSCVVCGRAEVVCPSLSMPICRAWPSEGPPWLRQKDGHTHDKSTGTRDALIPRRHSELTNNPTHTHTHTRCTALTLDFGFCSPHTPDRSDERHSSDVTSSSVPPGARALARRPHRSTSTSRSTPRAAWHDTPHCPPEAEQK